MMLRSSHPYWGLATKLNNTMTDDTKKATQGRRLAKAKDRIEELESALEKCLQVCEDREFCGSPEHVNDLIKISEAADDALDAAEDGFDE